MENIPNNSKEVRKEAVMAWLKNLRIKQTAPYFEIDQFNASILAEICAYYSDEPGQFDKSRGLLLFGNVGCRKTTIMRLFSENPSRPFYIHNCRKIASDYSIHGDSGIERYYKWQIKNDYKQQHGICLEDLGDEPMDKNHYGAPLNVLEDVIKRRYDNRIPYALTHATTNLTRDELLQRYGTRTFSRIKEMFNFIIFPTESPNFRDAKEKVFAAQLQMDFQA